MKATEFGLLEKTLAIVTKICRCLVYISAGCLFIGMVLNTIDVVAAKWLGWSIPGALDITEELMVYITILPIAYLAIERGHINITLIQDHVSFKSRKALAIFGYAIGVLVTAFLTWRVFSRLQAAFQTGELKKGIDLPTWPANVAVVLGFGFLFLLYLLLLLKTIKNKAV